MKTNANHPAPALLIVGETEMPLFGLSMQERIRRQFARAGVTRVMKQQDAVSSDMPLIAVRADAVLDQPLVQALVETPGLALLAETTAEETPLAVHLGSGSAKIAIDVLQQGRPTRSVKGLSFRRPAELDVKFWKALRKRETPYALVASPKTAPETEWRMFMGTYKGATDVITKHLWPVPAFHTTRFLAPLGVTPNMVTTVAAIFTVAAFWFFLQGQYGLGLIAAWAMTFLDTVDGKLARTTLTSSKWGDVFDHGIDLVHPPFWYAAWAFGLAKVGFALEPVTIWAVLAIILGGYVLQRVMEGIAIKWLGLEIHIWRKIDTLFRQVTARRNPNLILLTLGYLIGRPDWGLFAVAFWTGLCLILHGVQLAQALAARRAGPLSSWMTQG